MRKVFSQTLKLKYSTKSFKPQDIIFSDCMKVIGIDLAGLATNPSGFALLSGREISTCLLYSDEEMIDLCTRKHPSVISIDAPLTIPKRGNLRGADVSLIKRGFRVLPPTFGGMRSLTERGMRFANEFRAKNLSVIEIHPRTSGMILFKTSDRQQWVVKLKGKGFHLRKNVSEHEIDAAIAALTGILYLQGKTEEVGTIEEGMIIIPRGEL